MNKDLAIGVKYKNKISTDDLKSFRNVNIPRKLLISKNQLSQVDDMQIIPVEFFLLDIDNIIKGAAFEI